jgi:hypothetical protein
MAHRVVKVRKAWKQQTPRVAHPVTIIKPNGERFTVAPTHKRVAKRKASTKRKAHAKQQAQAQAQDTRAIELAERQRLFAESQKRLELEMRGAYN